jgi:hypothetical protein
MHEGGNQHGSAERARRGRRLSCLAHGCANHVLEGAGALRHTRMAARATAASAARVQCSMGKWARKCLEGKVVEDEPDGKGSFVAGHDK